MVDVPEAMVFMRYMLVIRDDLSVCEDIDPFGIHLDGTFKRQWRGCSDDRI